MKLLFAAVFVLIALSAFDQADSSAYDKIVTHSRIRAKNEGPNVCALQQVMGTKKKYFSTCRNWYQGAICGKKATVLYECCPGYMKLDGMRGCPAVAPIDHVYGTLGLVKAITTQEYSDISKLREEIEGSGSYTMFAPSNDAWDLLEPSVRSALVSNVNIELYNALRYHMVNRRLLTKDLKNGMTVTSMYNDLGLFINHYSNGVVTVNCARIIHGNQVATNGVVHVIDRVITAVGNTIQDVIEVNDELTSLSAVALASEWLEKLGQPGHFTLFAPTNEAFEKVDREVLERLMNDKGVLQALLKYHILDSVQCSEAIMAGTSYETLEGSNIEIGCDGESLTVNGIKMVLKKDIVTSNGVIHLIDQVLMPNSAKQVMELLGDSQSTFSDMVSELGLAAAMKPETEYTLLAPLNSVFTDEVMGMDQRLLKIILENHILKLKVTLSQLYNGQKLETIGGKLLRVFIYRTAVCIENACMVRGSKEGSNGALHLMRTLIKPAESTMYEILLADGRFKIFLSLMEAAGLTDLLNQEGGYTLFAPTDDAFEGLSPEDIELLTSDVNALRTILLYHFSNGVFITGGLEGGVTNLLKTIQGSNIRLLSANNSILVNTVNVPDNDLMASNGVIHIVKTMLYPGDLPVGREDLLVLLKKLIRYIQIKFVAGYTYREIPLTFIKRTIKVITEPITVTRIIETVPNVTTVTRVIEGIIEGEPTLTTVTKVIEGEPTVTKVTKVIEGEPTVTKVTRVIEGDPTVTKVTKVIEGEPIVTKVTRVIEGDPTITKVTRVIEGPQLTSSDGEFDTDGEIRKILGEEVTKVTKLLESDVHILEDEEIKQILEGGGIGYTTTVTKVIPGDPHIIKGPDFSKISTFEANPELIDAESERITKIIKEGKPVRRAAARRIPAGIKRKIRRHPQANRTRNP
ncbi:periostin-like [Megalops cyprinoides]|uniref:periostin-like n=1 Tax=Megalops cyprinoides TaxID=118141 RepID=UPI0018651595|nr:periostin-like [Megalops cyprinoides]